MTATTPSGVSKSEIQRRRCGSIESRPGTTSHDPGSADAPVLDDDLSRRAAYRDGPLVDDRYRRYPMPSTAAREPTAAHRPPPTPTTRVGRRTDSEDVEVVFVTLLDSEEPT
jgi:hypothetical protein